MFLTESNSPSGFGDSAGTCHTACGAGLALNFRAIG